VLERPSHPYTHALLEARVSIEIPRGEVIRGMLALPPIRPHHFPGVPSRRAASTRSRTAPNVCRICAPTRMARTPALSPVCIRSLRSCGMRPSVPSRCSRRPPCRPRRWIGARSPRCACSRCRRPSPRAVRSGGPSRRCGRSATSASRSARAARWRWSGRVAAARRRRCVWPVGCWPPTAVRCAGARTPDARSWSSRMPGARSRRG
jgi:hypothetical protein